MALQTAPKHAKFFKTVDGTNYAYLFYRPKFDQLPTLLLLHGFPSSTWDWRRLLPLLVTTGVGIVAPDLLGYGGTDKPTDPSAYRMKRMSGHMIELLDHEKLPKVIGVGHDWGSGLLSRMANYYPGYFIALTFMALPYVPPIPVDFDAFNKEAKALLGCEIFGYWPVFNSDDGAMRIEQAHDTFQSIVFAKEEEHQKAHAARAGGLDAWLKTGGTLPTYEWLSKEEMEIHAEILLGGGYTGPLNWYKQSMRGMNLEDEKGIPENARKLEVPTLFVACGRDVINNPILMLKMCDGWVRDLRVKVIDAGHWIILEAPTELAEVLKAFITDVTKQG
ncbi:hypothetical protein FH972_026212 [Carpinus fangiana]|uniref:AB hydrolase-1 domain-containing protein n=1 Tax=Carpinus fangiana TaxID=176857 RepID=A0A5N6L5X0_9ROSI|nr:hypothetical protein FH972_026212 [Carpinus fangiana]